MLGWRPWRTQRHFALRCVHLCLRSRLHRTQTLPLSCPGAPGMAVGRTHPDPHCPPRRRPTRPASWPLGASAEVASEAPGSSQQPHLYLNDLQVWLKLPRPRGTCQVTGTFYGFWTGEKPRRHRQPEIQLLSECTTGTDDLQQAV